MKRSLAAAGVGHKGGLVRFHRLHDVKLNLNSLQAMNDGQDDSLDSLSCDQLACQSESQVAIWRDVRDVFDALSDKQRGRFQRIMEMWCGGHKLPPAMFNGNEGRSNTQKLMLMAFKAFKIRLYGFVRRAEGKKTFIIVDIDPEKKQDKADPEVLKRAKKRVDDLA